MQVIANVDINPIDMGAFNAFMVMVLDQILILPNVNRRDIFWTHVVLRKIKRINTSKRNLDWLRLESRLEQNSYPMSPVIRVLCRVVRMYNRVISMATINEKLASAEMADVIFYLGYIGVDLDKLKAAWVILFN